MKVMLKSCRNDNYLIDSISNQVETLSKKESLVDRDFEAKKVDIIKKKPETADKEISKAKPKKTEKKAKSKK